MPRKIPRQPVAEPEEGRVDVDVRPRLHAAPAGLVDTDDPMAGTKSLGFERGDA